MTESADQVLQRELAKLGNLGGAGGAIGAAWAARRLTSSSAQAAFEVPMNAHDALAHAFGTLTEIGEILPDEIAPNAPGIRAVVGSGAFGMNPAVVDLSVEPVSDRAATVTVYATAKEGLIKQHAAGKAVRRFLERAGWAALISSGQT